MKSYFAINQNPDAKDLKQLAQKTGLSKRVLQVIRRYKKFYSLNLIIVKISKGLVSKRTCEVATKRDATSGWFGR